MTMHGAHQPALWCILVVRAAKTLKLAGALTAAGLTAWAPRKTVRRPAPGQRRALVLGTRRKMVEVEQPIMPGFVFVAADQLDDLARLMHQSDVSTLPEFTVFQIAGRAPKVGEGSIAGLRAAEEAEAERIAGERLEEDRDKARRARADQLRTQKARHAALRRERRTFTPGESVTVQGMPALAGVEGRVIRGEGTKAVIDFGGTLTMSIEAWRVVPNTLCDPKASRGIAA